MDSCSGEGWDQEAKHLDEGEVNFVAKLYDQ